MQILIDDYFDTTQGADFGVKSAKTIEHVVMRENLYKLYKIAGNLQKLWKIAD